MGRASLETTQMKIAETTIFQRKPPFPWLHGQVYPPPIYRRCSFEIVAEALQVLANLLLLYTALLVFGLQYVLHHPPTDSRV